ncbi:MAG: hypothetical protein CBE26_04985 [Kiritimatiellaceae bacterium TMED266]|nr:MAG: hypothetical protein CBE26_04985 [Kiritimatiellaceae bacterium TMED266]
MASLGAMRFLCMKIWYQDEALLAVEKPSGLLSVPGRGTDKTDCLLRRGPGGVLGGVPVGGRGVG